LWTVGVFLFGVLPLCIKRKAGRILIGDEYDCSQKSNFKGITHYNALYDQSKYFDNNLTRYFLKKGWNINQFSILRSLSELLIEKILSKRYPELQEQQISCHAAHEKINRMYPCGKCEKCRRIVGMLMALKISPKKCGYSEEQIKTILEQLTTKKVKQIGSDAAYLYYLLSQNNLIKLDDNIKKLIKNNFYVMNLRFDKEKSNLTDMPQDIRFDVLKIFLEYTDGAVKRYNYKWNAVDILNDPHMNQSYPFEISLPKREKREFLLSEMKSVFWEKSTWEEINERLKCVDTAILPCGSIEQHGPHLPVDVDYYDVVYLAQKVVEACSEPKPFIVPAIPYGVSYHHDDFKGTISVSNNSLSLFVYDIGVNLARNGIKKIIILNGHGDNAPTLNFAAQMINRDAHIFVCVESGESSDPDLAKLINTPNDIHAGEIETSTTLAIRPDYVRMEKAVDNTLTFGSNYMDFSSKRGVPWYVRTKKISRTGIMGNPTKATAEKGKNMWEIMITHLVRFVEEVKTTKLEDLYHKKI
ncbi:MAG: creatininase family protein, partial [Chitinispirillia bacterium]